VIFQHDPVLFRFEGCNALLQPLGLAGNTVLLRPSCLVNVIGATTHECPGRLVIMIRAWLNDRHIKIGLLSEQGAGNGHASCAATHDYDSMLHSFVTHCDS